MEPVTVVGTGPLAGGRDPGLDWLVAVGASPLWGTMLPDFLGPAGPAWQSLGIDALVLHGRAAEPCALALQAGEGTLHLRRLPLTEGSWSGSLAGGGIREGMPVGTEGLRQHLLEEGWASLPSASAVLLTGPAALRSRLGSLRLRPLLGESQPEHERTVSYLADRGGLGSRLAQLHRIWALAFAGPAGAAQHEAVPPEAEEADEPPFSMLVPLREWLLSFNNRSVYFPRPAREQIYEQFVARNLLSQLESRRQPVHPQSACPAGCPKSCREHQEYRRFDEPVLAFGPQLGVFDLEAVDALARFADALGIDLLEGAGLVAWLMECLESGWLEPVRFGLPGLPRWDPEDLDPLDDSIHNASLAGGLLESLFLGGSAGGEPLVDLRAAALLMGGQAGEAAVYLAAGHNGWQSPSPIWGPDFLVPLALPVRTLLRDRYEHLPPVELGQRAARWLVVELALANLGICPERRRWAHDGGLQQAYARRSGGHGGWEEHHRRLAGLLERELEHVPLPTHRGEETLARSLLLSQLSILPDADLDRWVARMRRDTAEGCRSYLALVRHGVEEYLQLQGS